jgi:hypothetical protein
LDMTSPASLPSIRASKIDWHGWARQGYGNTLYRTPVDVQPVVAVIVRFIYSDSVE